MILSTRFKKGDTIYFIDDSMACKGKIIAFDIFFGESLNIGFEKKSPDKNDPLIKYYVKSKKISHLVGVDEENAYSSKEELAEEIVKNIYKL